MLKIINKPNIAKSRLSIIVPTLNEAENLSLVIQKIAFSLKTIDYRILIVDDNSKDSTPEIIKKLRIKYPVKLITRKSEKGLSSAVIRGINESDGEIIAVMDADLSHPPEKLIEMYKKINDGFDLAIGSRCVGKASRNRMPLGRRIISHIAAWCAWPITRIKDPMSGFFMIRRNKISGMGLSGIGYKIMLEIVAKRPEIKFTELPIYFNDRLKGESKLKASVVLEYLHQIFLLYFDTFLNSQIK